jgi:hypothetical protein
MVESHAPTNARFMMIPFANESLSPRAALGKALSNYYQFQRSLP